MPVSEVKLMDNMEYMGLFPDKFFDLAFPDPPYGIGEDGGDKKRGRKGDGYRRVVNHEKKDWDKQVPSKEYWDELFRVSKNQLVFGGNYFSEYLPSRMGWIFWDKQIGGDFSDGELIWSSFNKALRKFVYSYHGDTAGGHTRIHPTQKPKAVYRYGYQYAKLIEGAKILDPNMGSQSSRIVAYQMGFDYYGCEGDEQYFNEGNARFEREIHGVYVTASGEKKQQQKIF